MLKKLGFAVYMLVGMSIGTAVLVWLFVSVVKGMLYVGDWLCR
jgi:uncharacterized membrane protein